ncbi:MAG: 23S rRNA (pseudouridine(1915)-N(3))-methyltransferase RlmH [Patescibacteria group bacterium]
MKIRIIQVGKTKDKYIEEGLAELVKRLKAFAKLEIVTLKEVAASKAFTREHCKDFEGKQILQNLQKDEVVILLDEKGREMNSVEFAGFLEKYVDEGREVVFVIGGPFGLSEEVKKKANATIALSKMTFTHQMVRLFLLEQIYRGFCIINGKEYHHE